MGVAQLFRPSQMIDYVCASPSTFMYMFAGYCVFLDVQLSDVPRLLQHHLVHQRMLLCTVYTTKGKSFWKQLHFKLDMDL